MINMIEGGGWFGGDIRVFYKIINSFKIHFFIIRRECKWGLSRFTDLNNQKN
jgi:hypothetical protein